MEQELSAALEAAAIPAPFKLALADLAGAVDALQPGLPAVDRWLSRARARRIIGEATDPALDTHFWETYLYLLAGFARTLGATGEAVVEACDRLAPLMTGLLGPHEVVTLQPVTAETVWGISALSDTLADPQNAFVAPNAISMAEAHFNEHAWFRAIYAGKAAAGFLMLYDDDEKPEYFLWRFMIAAPHQGRGYGRQAILRLVEYVRTRPNAVELQVSCGEGEGSPKEFYLKQGFVPTGEVLDEEIVLRMALPERVPPWEETDDYPVDDSPAHHTPVPPR